MGLHFPLSLFRMHIYTCPLYYSHALPELTKNVSSSSSSLPPNPLNHANEHCSPWIFLAVLIFEVMGPKARQRRDTVACEGRFRALYTKVQGLQRSTVRSRSPLRKSAVGFSTHFRQLMMRPPAFAPDARLRS